jgi:type I restriction-modification system DNA methylase subunit
VNREPDANQTDRPTVDQATHNKIVSFIWGIADDVLRDLFKRGKYPDVILPMCVLRRMDAVLEPTKQAVLDTRKMLDEARITEQRAALASAAGQAFYNTSRFTLRDLASRSSFWRTSRTTSTASRPTSRTFWTTSSFATSSAPCPKPTR